MCLVGCVCVYMCVGEGGKPVYRSLALVRVTFFGADDDAAAAADADADDGDES